MRVGDSALSILRRAVDSALLEEQSAHAAHLALLLDEDLKVLVDDGDGKKNAGAGADGPHEVGQDGQSADAEAAESGGGGDVAI